MASLDYKKWNMGSTGCGPESTSQMDPESMSGDPESTLRDPESSARNPESDSALDSFT